MEKNKCNNCGHVWMPRNTDRRAVVCPKCKNYLWDKERPLSKGTE